MDQLDHWADYAHQDGFVPIQPERDGLFLFISFAQGAVPHETAHTTIRIDPARRYWKEFSTAAIKVREMVRPHLEPVAGAPSKY